MRNLQHERVSDGGTLVQRLGGGEVVVVAFVRALVLVETMEDGMTANPTDSPELIEELAALRERIDRLERERPRCPTCFDRGWTEGGTRCGCQRKDGQGA